MAKSTVWRITAVDTQGQELVLSRLRLLASGTRVDSGAVLTCTAAPVSGALADLLDDSAASCRFAAADVSAPGFQLVLTLPAEQDVNGVELGLVSSATAPVALTLEGLNLGRFLVAKEFRGILTSGAPALVQVGDLSAGSLEQGFIVALRAGSGVPEYNAFDRSAPTWAANFSQTIDMGLFANAGTDPGDTGVLPTKVLNQFSKDDTWTLEALNGTWYGDIAQIDIEFLRADSSVVAAIRLTKGGGEFSTDMYYGPSLASMTKASLTDSYGWPDGNLKFSATEIVWVPSARGNNHAAWTLSAPVADVRAVRFSNARAASNYGGPGSARVAIKRSSSNRPQGYTGSLPYRTTALVQLATVSRSDTVPQDIAQMSVVGAAKFLDAEFGGRGFLYGVVKEHETQSLLQRRVRLFRSRDGYLMREVWSAADGSYRFEGINERYEYDIEAWDHEKNFYSVVANNQIPEVAA